MNNKDNRINIQILDKRVKFTINKYVEKWLLTHFKVDRKELVRKIKIFIKAQPKEVLLEIIKTKNELDFLENTVFELFKSYLNALTKGIITQRDTFIDEILKESEEIKYKSELKEIFFNRVLKENFKARDKITELEKKIENYEKAKNWKKENE